MISIHQQPTHIDILERLKQQNYYQRLGLATNAVNPEGIDAAHAVRTQLFQESYQDVPAEDLCLIHQLLDEAYATLGDPKRRRRYDRALWKAHRKSTTGASDQAPVEPAPQGTANSAPRVTSQVVSIPATVADNTRTASAHSSDWELAGGRYQEQHVLAEGDRSVIYSGIDTRLNRRVVIKKIRSELVHAQEHRRLFREEAELFAGSNAGNLVKILDYDPNSGSMVLERLKCDLSTLLCDKGCDYRLVREILRDALNGLASLHALNIAHGRVELRHLLMDDAGGVKLAVTPGMTGYATALRPGAHAMHFAPELLNSNVFGPPGLAIDIYAMGFVALELLGGKQLAQRVSPAIESAESIASGWLLWHSSPTDHLPPLETLIPGLPGDLASLLGRMTSKQQHERFSDALAAREAMRDLAVQPMRADRLLPPEDALMQGADVYGEPPPLRPAYDHVQKLQWRDIWQDPKLLLQPQGRNHASVLLIATLICVSMIMMMMRPIQPLPATSDSAQVVLEEELFEDAPFQPDTDVVEPQEVPAPEIAQASKVEPEPVPTEPVVEGWQVRFRVRPSGIVDSIAGQSMDFNTLNQWTLRAGSYRVLCKTGDQNQYSFEATVAIPPGHGQLGIDIEAPAVLAEPSAKVLASARDPYQDVRGLAFHPANVCFDYVGTSDKDTAQAQVRALRQNLSALIDRTNLPRKHQLPFQLDTRPFDPRASFTLALMAYHHGDYDLSKDYCMRSIRDAQYWNCPFVLPVRLLSQIHVARGDYSSALSTCRNSLQWINRQLGHGDDVNFKHAGDHVAWWAGSILAFVQETRPLHSHSQVDLDSSLASFREVCNDEQWTKYRIARCQVSDRVAELASNRGEERPNILPATFTSEGNPNSLPLSTVSYARKFARGLEQQPDDYDDEEVETQVKPTGQPSPRNFVSYRPCDITTLADATLLSISLPGER